jgi:beta-carotene 3-hydroxylase
MLDWIKYLAIAFFALIAMEAVAYWTHKYIMHGPLWSLHEDHHRVRKGTFEKNDLFAVFFSLPSIIAIYFGVRGSPELLWLGIGIAGYGVVYFIFHDVIVHRRIRLAWKPKSRYMKRLIKAHWLHHASREKEGAISFGFIYSPPIAKLEAKRARLNRGSADSWDVATSHLEGLGPSSGRTRPPSALG